MQISQIKHVMLKKRRISSFRFLYYKLKTYNEILLIILSFLFFIGGLIFKKSLHNTFCSLGEYAVFFTAYILSGKKVLINAGKNIFHGRVFDENFLMSIATIGAIIIHELPEAVAVMLFFKIGDFLENLSVQKSRNSIKSLLKIKPEYAYVKKKGKIKRLPPEKVKPGDIIIVKPGEKIPLDGSIIEGSSEIDASPLTGESIPLFVNPGDKVFAGTINKTGLLTINVTRPLNKSSISKILELTEKAIKRKSETEKFITQFAKYYTPLVVITAFIIAFVPSVLFKASLSLWTYRALVLLVISCPCALVISIPLGYFGGIGKASKKGILIKGSNYIDMLTKVKTVIFDKTGTLTRGTFKVTEVVPKNKFNKEELLYLASQAESNSNHPIARSIKEAYRKKIKTKIKKYTEIPGYGVKVKIKDYEVLAGNDRLLHREHIKHDVCRMNKTVVHVAVNQKYAGYIIISDELRKDAQKTINELRKMGIKKIIMFTGDNRAVAKSITNKLSLDGYFAELLPEDKVKILEKLIKKSPVNEKIAFVGDGINDAPSIGRADVGIAMGAFGSDAAIETADIVIMTDTLLKIPESIKLSKKVKRIVWQNIFMALSIKGVLIFLGALGIATMWEAVFADVGVTLLAIFNSTRILLK